MLQIHCGSCIDRELLLLPDNVCAFCREPSALFFPLMRAGGQGERWAYTKQDRRVHPETSLRLCFKENKSTLVYGEGRKDCGFE